MSFVVSSSFPKELKIRKSSEYEKIFGKGKKLHTEHFSIMYVPNTLGYSRAGLLVAKKNVPGAVGRNRVKRVLREVFRQNKSFFDSMDVLFIAKKGSQALDYSQAKKEIEEILRSELS